MTSLVREDAAVADRLRVVLTRLGRLLRQRADGLTPSQLSALTLVEDHGPLRVSALAALEAVDPSVASRIVASLEEKGWCERRVDPSDRRASVVAVTEAGRRRADEAVSARTLFIAERMATLSAGDRRKLEAGLEVLERLVR